MADENWYSPLISAITNLNKRCEKPRSCWLHESPASPVCAAGLVRVMWALSVLSLSLSSSTSAATALACLLLLLLMAVFCRNAAMHQWFKWVCDECVASLSSLASLWHVASLYVCASVCYYIGVYVCAWHSICFTFSIGHFACFCATLCALLSISEGKNEGEKREGKGIEANMENREIAFCSSKEKPKGRLPM